MMFAIRTKKEARGKEELQGEEDGSIRGRKDRKEKRK
jgi:hypothetical protein